MALQCLCRYGRSLRRLTARACPALRAQHLRALVNLPQLRHLDLGLCPLLRDDVLRHVPRYMLTSIGLAHASVTDAGVEELVRAFPTVTVRLETRAALSPTHVPACQSMDLSGCAKLTDAAVRILCQYGARLRFVSLRQCPVSSAAVRQLGQACAHPHVASLAAEELVPSSSRLAAGQPAPGCQHAHADVIGDAVAAAAAAAWADVTMADTAGADEADEDVSNPVRLFTAADADAVHHLVAHGADAAAEWLTTLRSRFCGLRPSPWAGALEQQDAEWQRVHCWEHSALVIQCAYRRRAAMQRLHALRQARLALLRRSAVQIQRVARGWAGRRRAARLRASVTGWQRYGAQLAPLVLAAGASRSAALAPCAAQDVRLARREKVASASAATQARAR